MPGKWWRLSGRLPDDEAKETLPAGESAGEIQPRLLELCSGDLAQRAELFATRRLRGLVVEPLLALRVAREQLALSGTTPPGGDDELRFAAPPGTVQLGSLPGTVEYGLLHGGGAARGRYADWA